MDDYTTVPFFTKEYTDLIRQYNFLQYGAIGKTILKEDIPYFRIGVGPKNILFIGGADATDSVSEAVLISYIDDLCRHISLGKDAYRISSSYLFESRSIWILPRVNPDGKVLVTKGADPSCPLYERQLRQNNMKSDFSKWQGNARGVLPTLNFANDFAARREAYLKKHPNGALPCGEFPESEPESAAIAALIRMIEPICLVELSQGKPMVFSPDSTASVFSTQACSITDFPMSECPTEAICAWFWQAYHRPCVQILCPHKKTGVFSLSSYHALREYLFRVLTLVHA